VDAIHPGIGFLSENQKFAAMDRGTWLRVYRPRRPNTSPSWGTRSRQGKRQKSLGIPSRAGVGRFRQRFGSGSQLANKIGFPVLVKAAAGGAARDEDRQLGFAELSQALNLARKRGQA
jgi:acetyl-CoA carboxylase biotin carboxylase subunit